MRRKFGSKTPVFHPQRVPVLTASIHPLAKKIKPAHTTIVSNESMYWLAPQHHVQEKINLPKSIINYAQTYIRQTQTVIDLR